MRVQTLALALTCTLGGAGPAVAGPGPGAVGAQAADFTLPAFGGGTYTRSDYLGKVVMLFVVGYG